MDDFMKDFYGGKARIQPFEKSQKAKKVIPNNAQSPVTMTKDLPVSPVVSLYGDVDMTPVSQRAEDLWRLRKAGEMVDPDLMRANVQQKMSPSTDRNDWTEFEGNGGPPKEWKEFYQDEQGESPMGNNAGTLDFQDPERRKDFERQIGRGQQQLEESRQRRGEAREPSGAQYTHPSGQQEDPYPV